MPIIDLTDDSDDCPNQPTHIIDLRADCPNRPLSQSEAAIFEDSIFNTCMEDFTTSKRRRTSSPQHIQHSAEPAQVEDSLCGFFLDPPSPVSDAESFDSQLTANEDPMTESEIAPAVPTIAPVHFSNDDNFWLAVAEHDEVAKRHSWYDSGWFWDAPATFEDALPAASAFIARHICDSWDRFKIGITENITRRWNDPKMGYKFQGYATMFLLYAAPTSKTRESPLDTDEEKQLKRESTGAFERALIAEWASHSSCKNKEGTGGECPSSGSPHFVYVVVA